jgi:hypothetical protein
MTEYIRFHVGARKKCLVIDIYLDGELPNLTAISYNMNCNIEGNMMKTQGTVHMAKTAMKFVNEYINKHYKEKELKLDVYVLKDNSIIPCKRNYELPLSVYYMAKYTCTWYERHLGAKPEEKREEFKKNRRRLIEYMKTKPSEEVILSNIPSLPEKVRKYIGGIYKNVSSLSELLYTLRESDCYLFKGWLERLVNNYLPGLYGMSWLIDTKELQLEKLIIEVEKIDNQPDELFIQRGGVSSSLL